MVRHPDMPQAAKAQQNDQDEMARYIYTGYGDEVGQIAITAEEQSSVSEAINRNFSRISEYSAHNAEASRNTAQTGEHRASRVNSLPDIAKQFS